MHQKITRGAKEAIATLLVFLLCFVFYAACYSQMK